MHMHVRGFTDVTPTHYTVLTRVCAGHTFLQVN